MALHQDYSPVQSSKIQKSRQINKIPNNRHASLSARAGLEFDEDFVRWLDYVCQLVLSSRGLHRLLGLKTDSFNVMTSHARAVRKTLIAAAQKCNYLKRLNRAQLKEVLYCDGECPVSAFCERHIAQFRA